jgi:hypothetical protein
MSTIPTTIAPPPVAPQVPVKKNGSGVKAPRAGTTSCAANTRETHIGFGFKPQADLVTANLPAELWSVTKTNSALMTVDLMTETDALDIGKGNEFPTTVFKTSASVSDPVEKFCTSEFMAWLFAFALGKATKTPAGVGFTYAAVPQDPAVDCINLPPFTVVEEIRPEPDSVIDRAALGMVVNDFTLSMESGPGRNNCRVSTNWLGTGSVTTPSGIVIPAITQEHLLNANGTAVLTVNGIDYMLGGNFISLEFAWNNNVRTDSGYFPGSGTNNGFGIRGRMEYGTRALTLNFVVRAQKGSQEFNDLINQTEGATTITVNGADIDGVNKHGMNLQFPRTVLSASTNGDADGIVTVQCSCMILNPTDGVTPLCTLSATTTMDGILGL